MEEHGQESAQSEEGAERRRHFAQVRSRPRRDARGTPLEASTQSGGTTTTTPPARRPAGRPADVGAIRAALPDTSMDMKEDAARSGRGLVQAPRASSSAAAADRAAGGGGAPCAPCLVAPVPNTAPSAETSVDAFLASPTMRRRAALLGRRRDSQSTTHGRNIRDAFAISDHEGGRDAAVHRYNKPHIHSPRRRTDEGACRRLAMTRKYEARPAFHGPGGVGEEGEESDEEKTGIFGCFRFSGVAARRPSLDSSRCSRRARRACGRAQEGRSRSQVVDRVAAASLAAALNARGEDDDAVKVLEAC